MDLATLDQIDTRTLDLNQPSGLAFDASRQVLWAVGNQPERVYKLSLSGEVLDSIAYVGNDVEGVVFDPSDSSLWIAEEREREVVHIRLDGTLLGRTALDVEGKSNSGLEGIALGADGNLFVLNEKDPGLLIALASDLSIRKEYELQFAQDYSGLSYDADRDGFWISSHQDRCLHLWNERDGLVKSFEIPIKKIEGVAVDSAGSRLYVVSESEGTLTVFALAPAEQLVAE